MNTPETESGPGRKPGAFSFQRQTTTFSRIQERVATWLFTIVGWFSIIAVLGVAVFLLSVAAPLFTGAEVGETVISETDDRDEILLTGVDEYGHLGWALTRDARVMTVSLRSGKVLAEKDFSDARVETACFVDLGDSLNLYLEDGSRLQFSCGFEIGFPDRDALPADLQKLKDGEWRVGDDGLYESAAGAIRRHSLTLGEVVTDTPGRVFACDAIQTTQGERRLYHLRDGRMVYETIETTRNFMTGEVTRVVTPHVLRIPQESMPSAVLTLNGQGDQAFMVRPDGHFRRLDLMDPEEPEVIEEGTFTRNGRMMGAWAWMSGRNTLLTSDDKGEISAWFLAEDPVGGKKMVRGHEFKSPGSVISVLSPSKTSRLFASIQEDGHVRLFHLTTEAEIGNWPSAIKNPVKGNILARDDHLAIWSTGEVELQAFDPKFPEATLSSLFTEVWYENYSEPKHVWQSSSGSDTFEPKFGLVPLVFGTIKGAFYSLMIAIPLGLLGAVYTSEYLDTRTKSRVKPLIEMMASLPSVVLGFVGALVLAPLVENAVPFLILCSILIPLLVFLAPLAVTAINPECKSFRGGRRLIWVLVPMALAVGLSHLLSGTFESILFDGDMKAWLDGRQGEGWTGWFLFLYHMTTILLFYFGTRRFSGPLSRKFDGKDVRTCALVQFLLVAGGALLSVFVVYLVSLTAYAVIGDLRGFVFDTYVQRNALVVGFVMSFAVIPIIYSIAEDSLAAVPGHLRAASLASGASVFQTSVRVVIPGAMSGLFSAVMTGMGRAVGETMVVLMAAGNTPLLELNIFNGFRTLSANLAVELPEAVKDSTHYRVLFFSALVLFLMTMVINTAAELVRMRARSRNSGL